MAGGRLDVSRVINVSLGFVGTLLVLYTLKLANTPYGRYNSSGAAQSAISEKRLREGNWRVPMPIENTVVAETNKVVSMASDKSEDASMPSSTNWPFALTDLHNYIYEPKNGKVYPSAFDNIKLQCTKGNIGTVWKASQMGRFNNHFLRFIKLGVLSAKTSVNFQGAKINPGVLANPNIWNILSTSFRLDHLYSHMCLKLVDTEEQFKQNKIYKTTHGPGDFACGVPPGDMATLIRIVFANPKPKFQAVVNRILHRELKGKPYFALHNRGEEVGCQSKWKKFVAGETCLTIANKLSAKSKDNICSFPPSYIDELRAGRPCYLATDPSDDPAHIQSLIDLGCYRYDGAEFGAKSAEALLLDMVMMANAEYFAGNPFSTMSLTVMYLRQTMDRDVYNYRDSNVVLTPFKYPEKYWFNKTEPKEV